MRKLASVYLSWVYVAFAMVSGGCSGNGNTGTSIDTSTETESSSDSGSDRDTENCTDTCSETDSSDGTDSNFDLCENYPPSDNNFSMESTVRNYLFEDSQGEFHYLCEYVTASTKFVLMVISLGDG